MPASGTEHFDSRAAVAVAAVFWPHRRRLRWRLAQAGFATLLVSALLLLLTSPSSFSVSAKPRRFAQLTSQSASDSSASRRLLLETSPVPTESTVDGNSSSSRLLQQLSSSYWAKVRRHFPNGGPDSPQYRMLETRCSVPSNETDQPSLQPPQQPPQPPVGFADFPYLENFGPCTGRVSIVLAVHSAVDHADRRRVIRQTWGSVRYVRGRRLLLAFFLGRPVGPDADSRQAAVAAEAARHRDIVQRDFADTYRNMTVKHLGLFDWLAEFCQSADWLVKLDDDVFVDVFHLEVFLGAYRPGAGLCCKVQGGKPEREPTDKWFLTRHEFPDDKFPKYCEGYAYVIKPTLAQLLYWCSMFSRHLWIDDVYVLGVLVHRLGLPHQPSVPGNLWADLLPSHMGRAIVNNIFMVDRHNGLQSSTWRRLHRAAMKYSF